MKLMKTLSAGAAAIALTTAFAAVVSTPVMAQQTTSDIGGAITDSSGAPISGATVRVTDTRTGATRTATTDVNGGFSARNLTIGGPYTVTVSASGYQSSRVEGVSVSLGGSTQLTLRLNTATAADDEIVVVASRANTAELAIGPSSSFGLDTLEAFPSIARDIRDVIRLDPRVSINETNDDNVSCLGGNNRFNSFTIDGVRQADGFGLNASGFVARNTLPIPFDSVRETSVEFSPFDVEYGQFTGCNINVVTKSGSNEFHGSAFAAFQSSGLTGKTIEDRTVISESFKDYNWGATIGGPIIKDRLFFFAAYEETKDNDTQDEGPIGAGFASETFLTQADADLIGSTLSSLYGRETGGIVRTLPQDSRRILGRVDWLITDDHRLEATYSRIRESNIEEDDFGFDGFAFRDNFENEGTKAETYSVRLFSQWSDNFSTELRASRNEVTDLQNPLGGGEAQDANPKPRIIVQDGMGDDIAVSGPGFFRSANALEYQIDQIRAKGDYTAGAHTFTLGYELDQLDVFNLFAPNATGTIIFDSIADLQAGSASFIFGNGSGTGDINDIAAEYSRSIHTIYAQDEWQANDALTLTFGLRYDFYASNDTPPESPNFVSRYGFSNSTGFDNLSAIQPRFGFTYDAGDTIGGATTFRGGAGVFSGGDPTVWFSNAFSNNGAGIGSANIFDAPCSAADLQVISGGAFTGLPSCITTAQIAQAAGSDGRVDAIDPNFDLPTVIRGSLGLTHNTDFGGMAGGFFDDWRVDVDVIYTARRNAPDFVDLTLTPTGQLAPDGRPLFNAVDPLLAGCTATFAGIRQGFSGGDLSQGGACDAGGDDQDILLTNVDGDNGYSTSISAILTKGWDYNWFGSSIPGSFDLQLGYAYTKAKDVNPSTSSTATSNFEEVAVAVINNPVVADTQFVNNHNATLAARFSAEFVKDYRTSLNFFFRANSGRRFSYVYDNNTPTTLFGDSDNEERNLFYVPTGPSDPNVDFSGLFPGEQQALFAFLESSGLNQYAGQIAPRNVFKDDWTLDLDLRFEQEFRGVRKQDRAIFFVDVDNLPNLFTDDANIFRRFDRGDVAEGVPVLDAALSADGSQYIYSNFNPGLNDDICTLCSVWQVQIGFRYEF